MASSKTSKTRNALFDNSHVVTPGADLYRGDCLAVLPGLAGPFDAVVTDPPYSSGGQSKGDRARSTGDKYLNAGSSRYPDFLGDTKDQRSYLHWSALWMSLCFERMAEGALMLVFSDWRQLPVATDAMQAAGVTWRGIAVWDKTGGARLYKGGFRSQAEFVVWGSRGPLVGERYSAGVFRVNPLAGGRLHQVSKPLPLMEELVAACGDRILDPFMGSATTGLATLRQGKHFTGIEASRHYFQVALDRLNGSAKSRAN